MNTQEISKQIFSSNPKDSHSIQLEFPPETTMIQCFQSLLEIFTEGMKILHGDLNGKVNLSQLTEDDFYQFKTYFRSFGYECLYKIFDYHQAVEDGVDFESMKFTNKKITPYTRLEELLFPLRIDDTVYVIYFSHYMPETTCGKELIQ